MEVNSHVLEFTQGENNNNNNNKGCGLEYSKV